MGPKGVRVLRVPPQAPREDVAHSTLILLLSAQRGYRPRIVSMGRAPLGAKVSRTTVGTGISDREGPSSWVEPGLARGARSAPEQAFVVSGGQLRGLQWGGGRSSGYFAIGAAVLGVGAAVFGCLGDEQLDPGLGQGSSDLCGGSLLRYQAVCDR